MVVSVVFVSGDERWAIDGRWLMRNGCCLCQKEVAGKAVRQTDRQTTRTSFHCDVVILDFPQPPINK